MKPIGETRLRERVVESALKNSLPSSGLIREDDLERGLLLLNDLPGIDVRSVLQPGATIGTSNLTAALSEGPLSPAKSTSTTTATSSPAPYRLGGTLNLNDASGFGDLASIRLQAAEGASYARLGYAIPAGSSGLKIGAAYTGTTYELCCEFAALGARGDAQTATLSALYPVQRSRDASFYVAATYDWRHYFNAVAAARRATRKRRSARSPATETFATSPAVGGSATTASASPSAGSTLTVLPIRRVDEATARTDGNYTKGAYSFTRLQRLGETLSLYGGLAGQFASKNLDSSEKFVLGGPFGVRAYPTGEAIGDEGLLVNLELRHEFRPGLQLAAFLDHGQIRLHRNEWDGLAGREHANHQPLRPFGLRARPELEPAWKLLGARERRPADRR